MLETRRHRLGVEERYLASSRFLRAVGGVEGWRDLLTTLNTLVVDASSSSVAFPSSLLLLLRHKTHRYHPHTHTHTTKMASSPPLCNFFLYFILFFQGFLSFSENGSDPSTLFRPPLETFDNWEALIFSTIPFTHPPVVLGLCFVYSFTHTKIAADKSLPPVPLLSHFLCNERLSPQP